MKLTLEVKENILLSILTLFRLEVALSIHFNGRQNVNAFMEANKMYIILATQTGQKYLEQRIQSNQLNYIYLHILFPKVSLTG